jgi:hypothetical protein
MLSLKVGLKLRWLQKTYFLSAYEAYEKAEEGTELTTAQTLEQQQLSIRVMLIQALEGQTKNNKARDQAKTVMIEAENLKEPERIP